MAQPILAVLFFSLGEHVAGYEFPALRPPPIIRAFCAPMLLPDASFASRMALPDRTRHANFAWPPTPITVDHPANKSDW